VNQKISIQIDIYLGNEKECDKQSKNKSGLDTYSAFIISVEIESVIIKHWSLFKAVKTSPIDNIAYQDLMTDQNAKIKVIKGISGIKCKTACNN
jgi:hypothetical protein